MQTVFGRNHVRALALRTHPVSVTVSATAWVGRTMR